MYQPVAWEGNIVNNVKLNIKGSKQNMYQPVAWEGNMVINLNQIYINQLPGEVTWSKI